MNDLGNFMFLRKMISPVLITLYWWIGQIGLVMASLVMAFLGVKSESIGMLLYSFGILIFGSIIFRIACESMIVLFQIHSALERMTDQRAFLASRPSPPDGDRIGASPVMESPPADLIERARWLQGKGRTDEAIATLKEKLRESPSHIPALESLATLYEQRRDQAGLTKTLEKLTEIEPDNVQYLERYARAMKHQ